MHRWNQNDKRMNLNECHAQLQSSDLSMLVDENVGVVFAIWLLLVLDV